MSVSMYLEERVEHDQLAVRGQHGCHLKQLFYVQSMYAQFEAQHP